MNKEFLIPPVSKQLLTPPEIIAKRLEPLIGLPFKLTKKTRTDGSNTRKLIASTFENYTLPPACAANNYRIIPIKGKGVPKILREYVDTYIVTTGKSYNLQVWNRNPAGDSVQIEYTNGNVLSSKDIRFIFVRVDPDRQQIRSIIILSPEYIVGKFPDKADLIKYVFNKYL